MNKTTLFGVILCAAAASLCSCTDDLDQNGPYSESDLSGLPLRLGGANYVFDNLFETSSPDVEIGTADDAIVISIPKEKGVYTFTMNEQATYTTYACNPGEEPYGPVQVPKTLHFLPYMVKSGGEYYGCTPLVNGHFPLVDAGELATPFVSVRKLDNGFSLSAEKCKSDNGREYEVYLAVCKDVQKSIVDMMADMTYLRLIIRQTKQ